MEFRSVLQSSSVEFPASGGEEAKSPVRILVADDNPVFQKMLGAMLAHWGYDVIAVRDGMEAWKLLESQDPPRLAILDWMMPRMDGVEICRRLREHPREPYTYVILLTARAEANDLVEGMNAGADDYVTKPLKSYELRARLRAGRRIIDLQEQLLQAREALRSQATHDGLTGLLNRNSILEALENELARARRESQPLALLILDLDHFKDVNDTRGHVAGDAVLRETANRIKRSVRRYDSVGRYGGEEFLVVLPGCDSEHACVEAERVKESIGSSSFAVFGDQVRVTCSIGVGWRGSQDDIDPESLLRQADSALYVAKREGRNRVATFAGEAKPIACPV